MSLHISWSEHLDTSFCKFVNSRVVQAEVIGVDPKEVNVPVVGGHAGITILPLLSQTSPLFSFNSKEVEYLTNRIQNGGTEVVEVISPTLKSLWSMFEIYTGLGAILFL
jgi:malate dehydrogenase